MQNYMELKLIKNIIEPQAIDLDSSFRKHEFELERLLVKEFSDMNIR